MTREDTLLIMLAYQQNQKDDAEYKQSVIRFLDTHLAQLSYLTIAPHTKKSSKKNVSSYMLLKEPEKKPMSGKEAMLQQHHMMMVRAAERAKKWQEEKQK